MEKFAFWFDEQNNTYRRIGIEELRRCSGWCDNKEWERHSADAGSFFCGELLHVCYNDIWIIVL